MNNGIGSYILDELSKHYIINKIDIGSDATLSKGVSHFTVNRYDIQGVGNLCILSMYGFLALVKMETVVLAPIHKDMPLLNSDSISFNGQKIQLVEMYDARINPGNGGLEERCQAIKEQNSQIPDYEMDATDYSVRLMPVSYGKKSKESDPRIIAGARKYIDVFIDELIRAPGCDAAVRGEKNRRFAQSLLDNGGPAVNKMRKLFGEERTRRLVLCHMYGADT